MNGPAPMKPTVGRIVHFHLGGTKPPDDPGRGTFEFNSERDTYAAMVAAVDHDGVYVNLTVSDYYGNTFGRTMIPFVQPGNERPAGAWCEWPPIQNAGRVPVMPPIGEPPTLNTPADREQASRRAEEKHANDLVEANVAAIRAEKERIRHPVIAAAQELDNDGRPVDEPGTGPFDPPAPHIPQD